MTFPNSEQAVVNFVTREVGSEVTRVARLDAFATNVVYEVDAGERRFIVKASTLHDALRAEVWACARAGDAGCAAPAIVGMGQLATNPSMSAFIMHRVSGAPVSTGHPALAEVGTCLLRLHEVKLPGFGWMAETTWNSEDDFVLGHRSWLGFLKHICAGTQHLASDYAVAAPLADATTAVIDARSDALAAVQIGSLCHGDLKTAHILIDQDRLAGVIDWGDAVVADPLWDIARFAHRTDARNLSSLLAGYDPDSAFADEIEWRVPLYSALWMLVDAIVDHRLGGRCDATLDAAMRLLTHRAT